MVASRQSNSENQCEPSRERPRFPARGIHNRPATLVRCIWQNKNIHWFRPPQLLRWMSLERQAIS
jgi:hypothetical protein